MCVEVEVAEDIQASIYGICMRSNDQDHLFPKVIMGRFSCKALSSGSEGMPLKMEFGSL